MKNAYRKNRKGLRQEEKKGRNRKPGTGEGYRKLGKKKKNFYLAVIMKIV